IDELAAFFKCGAERFLKSLIYLADGKPVMAVVPGDREINEVKLKNALGALEVELAPDSVVEDVTGAPVGFAGPVTKKKIRTIFDPAISNAHNAITGANERDRHFAGVNPERDFQITEQADITSAVKGDACPRCGAAMNERKGIEVGHIFKLGYKYTKSMNLTVLDESGKAVHPIMGCYGIGVNRTMAAVIEQHNDEKGIVWPMTVAPFQAHLVAIAKTDEETAAVDEIYDMLSGAGIDVLYDDRRASAGVKFADADLIGMPIRVTVGKSYFKDGEIEVKLRSESEAKRVPKDEFLGHIRGLIEKEWGRYT
ncbi:MAG TPA: YbaK/EbsC family protein, partial [Spirochaetota bacterium]|nr:YbaK/EbsC family protein [Spirochaetota bacterium]